MKEILDARKSTHGAHQVQFACAQLLKEVFRNHDYETRLGDKTCTKAGHVMAEALDQIAHKISRILTGDPTHADHWRDIAGYATIIADDLEVTVVPITNAQFYKSVEQLA